jgi:hypothetical protein
LKIICHCIIFIFSIIFISSCYCSNCIKQDNNPDIPDSIFVKGDQFIISKTGQNFFDNYIFRNYPESQKISNFYELHYSINDSEREFILGKILFYVDSNGTHLSNYETRGIPDCITIPESCIFKITKEEAIKIAKHENLKKGIKPWSISFRWSAEFNMYLWHIISTTSELENEHIQKAEGEEILISPSNGEVLKLREWHIH